MEPLLVLAIGAYAVISVLLAFLAYTYAKTAFSTKARYPLGLFVFSILLLAHSAGTAMWYAFLGDYVGDQAYPIMFGMATVELIGIAALFRITV
jgi:hypothetical protein